MQEAGQSAISNQQSAISNRQSAIGNPAIRQSAIREFGIGKLLIADC
jgi:hypothetical protein